MAKIIKLKNMKDLNKEACCALDEKFQYYKVIISPCIKIFYMWPSKSQRMFSWDLIRGMSKPTLQPQCLKQHGTGESAHQWNTVSERVGF